MVLVTLCFIFLSDQYRTEKFSISPHEKLSSAFINFLVLIMINYSEIDIKLLFLQLKNEKKILFLRGKMKFYLLILILIMYSTKVISSTKIIGGNDVDKQPLIEKSTVSLIANFNGYLKSFCTGTVIGKKIVLTAAHCLANLSLSELFIGYGKNPLASKLINVSHFKYYFTNFFLPISENYLHQGRDIAILKTEEELPLEVIKIGSSNKLAFGDIVLQAGYGTTRVEELENNPTIFNSSHLFMLDTNTVVKLSSQVVYIQQNSNHRVSIGDSGGPLFKKVEDGLKLHGVLSQSAIEITSDSSKPFIYFAYYTHPHYFGTWINCSLPDNLKIEIEEPNIEQIPCDDQPLLSLSQLASFNSTQCQNQRPGFNLIEPYGCWPAKKMTCELYSQQVGNSLFWDETLQICKFKI
jgi:hypothetical protein